MRVLHPGVWAACSLVLVACPAVPDPEPVLPEGGFSSRALDVNGHNLRDIGVTDVDGDGNLDIYTINHSAPGTLLAGDGMGGFVDRSRAWGWGADPAFPGLVASRGARVDEGVAIWWDPPALVIEAAERARGSVAATAASVQGATRASASIEPGEDDRSTVRFDLRARGRLEIAIRQPDLPVDVTLDDRARAAVGRPPVVRSGSFVLRPGRDRHAAAWADLDGDGATEVAIVRGGERGSLAESPVPLFAEVRSFDRSTLTDAGDVLPADGCPAQGTAWVDVLGDAEPELFVQCKDRHPDQLFARTPAGFVDRARDADVQIAGGRPFRWMDVDDDGDQDVLVAEPDGLAWYVRSGIEQVRRPVFGARATQVRTLAVGDVDADGHGDVLVAAGRASALLLGGTEVVPVRSLGLPGSLVAASLVDVDNDGWLDVFAVPGGLFVHDGSMGFARAAEQLQLPEGEIVGARVTWFDADNDGRQDMLGAFLTGSTAFPQEWEIRIWFNREPVGRWVQVDLVGGPAAGAVVRAGSRSFRAGDAEGSQFSHGHYRISIGFGADPFTSLEVTWGDGTVRTIEAPEGSGLIVESHDEPG